jgi:excisionase family DNA binding protein
VSVPAIATVAADPAQTTAGQPPAWLTVTEAADHVRVGARTIYGEVRAGRLRAARVGGRRELRFRTAWLDAWLEASAAPVEVSRG